MFLQKDSVIEINSTVAERYGVQAAMIYNRIGVLEAMGQSATADTLASAFPFLTKNQVKHSLRVLEGAGEITSEQPYRSKMDATKHYGFGSAE